MVPSLSTVLWSSTALSGRTDRCRGERRTSPGGLTGKWLIPLQNTTNQPPLAQLKNRALRQRIYEASMARRTRRERVSTVRLGPTTRSSSPELLPCAPSVPSCSVIPITPRISWRMNQPRIRPPCTGF